MENSKESKDSSVWKINIRRINIVFKALCCIVSIIIIMFYGVEATHAKFPETIDLDITKWEKLSEKIRFQFRTAQREGENFAVDSFDVNSSHQMALGYGKRIDVYDARGEKLKFLYGFTFDITGTYEMEWEGECLWIYIVRGSYGIKLDNTGRCIAMQKISDSSIKNNGYWHELKDRTHKNIDSVRYEMTGPTGIWKIFSLGRYTQIIKKMPDDSQIILLDERLSYFISRVAYIICISVLCLISLAAASDKKKSKQI